MKELRDNASRLGRASQPDTQQVVIDTLTSLLAVLEKMNVDIAELKIRQGKLGSQAAEQAAETTNVLLDAFELKVGLITEEVRDLRERLARLEERAIGDPPKEST